MSDLSQQDIQNYFMTGHAGFWKIEYKDQQNPKLYADEQWMPLMWLMRMCSRINYV